MRILHSLSLILILQDVLAAAVAQQMQKVYKTELGPAPVPLTVEGDEITEDEVGLLLVCNKISNEKMSIEFDSLYHMAAVITLSEVLSWCGQC